jgi:beta-lactamase class A
LGSSSLSADDDLEKETAVIDDRFGSREMLAAVDASLGAFPGVLGFYARNLTTGEEVGHRADAVMPTASVIKVGIMAELYRQVESGTIDLHQHLTIAESDHYGGTGVLKEFMPGLAPTVLDLCRMMIVVSDNVATGMLVRLLGKDRINRSFAEWGLSRTELVWKLRLGDDPRQYAVSTARALGRLMALIATDGFLSAESCAAMRDHLSRQQHREQMPRYLPASQYAADLGVAQPVDVMNKIGNYPGMRADAAIVTAPGVSFVLAAMNEGSPELHFRVDQEGNVLNGRLAKAMFDAWAPPATIAPRGW